MRIDTYGEFDDFVTAFGDSHFGLLVICSRGGLGKSQQAHSTLDDRDIVWIGGHVTPLMLYRLLYEGRDKLVVFDEIDGLLANPQIVGLLKQLCETRDVKRIQWMSSDRRALEIDGGVGHFETTSRVLILCNSFEAVNANIAALGTRGTAVRFDPSPSEILARIKTFGNDPALLAFLDMYHEVINLLNLRTYGQLRDLKNGGLDWQRLALQEADIDPKVLEIADLLDRISTTDNERVEHYSGSRRDYYIRKPEAVKHFERRRRIAQIIEETASRPPLPPPGRNGRSRPSPGRPVSDTDV